MAKVGENFSHGQMPQDNSVGSGVVWITWLFSLCQYNGGDFMFLYRFVCRCIHRIHCVHCHHRPQTPVHTISFKQFFGLPSFLAWLIDYLILVNFHCDLDLECSRSNMEFAISQPKVVQLPRNERQTYWLNCRPQMWPSGLTLLMTLTSNFQGQISNLLYLNPKWSNCHITKSKDFDWTLGLKCDYQVWSLPWSWPWIFKVKYGICYISTKSGPIATKQKANILIELKVKCNLDLWPQSWPWPRISMVKFWSSCISRMVGLIDIEQRGWE